MSPEVAARASAWSLFVGFSIMSAKSWGGGSGTTYVMRQEMVRRGWITDQQFALDFGLSRIIPGINLLAMAVMAGYRLCGLLGAMAAICGLMAPASVITVVVTIGFVEFTTHPIGGAMVRGLLPVTAALTFALAYETAAGGMPFGERRVVAMMALYAVASFFMAAALKVSVVAIILGGAVLGALLFRPPRRAG